MYKARILIALYFFIFIQVINADWRKCKRDYERLRPILEKAGIPENYRVVSGGREATFNSFPEFGINVHIMNDETARGLKKAHIRYVRQTIYWNQFEKKAGAPYDPKALANLDKLVKLYKKHNLIPVFLVHGNPPGVSFKNRKEAYKRFADFMAFLAERYKYVRFWELWNEMDVAFTDVFGAGRKDVSIKQRGKYYAEMLKIAYPAIKKANPDAFVLTGGMVDANDFPKGIYEGGGKDYFDIMNIHTYGMPVDWPFLTKGHNVREIMIFHGDAEKPLWNTEFGVSVGSIVQAWGVPKSDPVKYYDDQQKEMIASCIDFNRKSGLYNKYFAYAYFAPDEAGGELKKKIVASLPKNMNINDFGFGFLRSDAKTPRPVLEYIIKSNPNKPSGNKRLERRIPVLRKTKRAQKDQARLTIKNRELMMNGKPFFPLGFVFGASDEDMKKAKKLGMNSIHQEYSLRDIFPRSDKVSAKGLNNIKDLHKRAKKNGLVYFPLLTGHYIPGWLNKKIKEGAPVNTEGKKIGLWFKFSIHNPEFMEVLEKFWVTIAKEVGNDPNSGAFVTWNEPGYGLDATPSAQKAFKKFLKDKYSTIYKMNETLGTSFFDFSSVKLPESPDKNRAYWYLWVSYNQQAFADFFAKQRMIFKKYAPQANLSAKHPVQAINGDALFCNDIVQQGANQDIYGCDAYNGSLFYYRDSMEVTRSLNTKGPVISYETHAQKGISPLKGDHAVLQLFTQILGGCRGLFFFSAGKIPGFGFYNEKATPPPVKKKYAELFQLINKNQAVFAAPRRKAEIAVLQSNASTIHYGTVKDSSKRAEYTKRLSQTFDMIRNQHFAVDFISDRQLADKLSTYKLLIIPSLSILNKKQLDEVSKFHKNGGKIIAFAKAFERDENFKKIEIPAFLGLKTRTPAPWNRSQMRLVEVATDLRKSFRTELIVQAPEMVNALPMEKAIPGYIPKTKIDHTWLVANQDAYPSVIQSTDGQIVYCAFDSIYSEGLSRLLGGIVKERLGLKREISARREGEDFEAIELMTAISDGADFSVLLVANTGPNKGAWKCSVNGLANGTLKDIKNKKTVKIRDREFIIELGAYEYGVYVFNK